MITTQSETTVSAILAAAETLFLAKNYADVSMEDIAQVVGVTKGALYYHFTSKEALYIAMMHTALQEKQVLFEEVVKSQGTCRERLRRMALIFFQLPREKRDLFKLVRRDINIFQDPARDQLIRAYQAALPEQLEAIIRDGIRDGELAPADPRLLSWLKVAMVEVVLTPYAESVFKDPDETVDFIINMFFNGVGAR
jgi:AcrR family transcriptional regulator